MKQYSILIPLLAFIMIFLSTCFEDGSVGDCWESCKDSKSSCKDIAKSLYEDEVITKKSYDDRLTDCEDNYSDCKVDCSEEHSPATD